jgi:hypothetical protein
MGRSDDEELTAAQIFYPWMHYADIFFLKVSIFILRIILFNLKLLNYVYDVNKVIEFFYLSRYCNVPCHYLDFWIVTNFL